MKKAIVSDLRRQPSEIGIAPARLGAPLKRPDFLARLKSIYGNKRLDVSGSGLLTSERQRF